jgi:hypothetical protein
VIYPARHSIRSGTLFWVAQASGLLFPASRRKPFATTIIVLKTANPIPRVPTKFGGTPNLTGATPVPPKTHTGGILAQTEA